MTEQTPATEAPRRERPHRRRRSRAMAWLTETVVVVATALVLSLLVKTFLVQAFWIPSGSMQDTLVLNDRVMVSKLRPGPFDLRRGDIVVFTDPGTWLGDQPVPEQTGWTGALDDVLTFVGLRAQDNGDHLIKRVIGLPGDRVSCEGPGEPVLVNGVELDESYLAEGAQPSELAFDVLVPPGYLWVMGDNRQQSADSRRHMGDPGGGAVSMDLVVGTAFVRLWPLDRLGTLPNPEAVFAGVPDPA